MNLLQIPVGISPTGVEAKPYGLEVTCAHSVSGEKSRNVLISCELGPGSAPHLSVYPWSWVREHSYDPPARRDVEGPTTQG